MYTNGKMLKRILKYTSHYSFIMVLALICALLYVSAMLFAPWVIGNYAINMFDDVASFNMSELMTILYIIAGIIVIGLIFGFLMGYLLNRVTYCIIKDLRIDAYKKILSVPVSYLDSHVHGDLLTRVINDTDQVADGLLQGFSQALTGIITIIVTVVFMLITKWQIALVVIVLTPLSMLGAYIISRSGFKTFKAQASVKGEIGGLINEMLSEQKVVLAYNMMDANNAKFQEIDARLNKVGFRAQFASSLANPVTRFVNAIVYGAVATIGAISIINNPASMNVGKLSIFLSYASQYTKPFNEISGVATELSNSFASLRRVFEFIDEKEITDESNLPDIKVTDGAYKLSDVEFSYVKDKPLLTNVNLDVKGSMKVAIVGPTGCGKTTLINLLMRYYDIDNGSIVIDGQDINSCNRDSLRNSVGMVLQDTWLFKGTVYENIAYAKDGATRDEVINASKLAYCDDFIRRLPNGYDTIVSDDEGVSIGQKQLLCIARLMLKCPQILILDEATSNIDTRTEIMVQKAFNNLMEGRTSFVIAHRLSTIRNSDLILVMKNGNIIESGNHDELIKAGGFYKTLYYSQFEE
ncbi:MAG: ABC transporter ATP-binding protein/permease [Acholeplasmatales bacterium]|nr:ABC transporter ATP-binding protein/permease [Acholeplasmatales bacterium]